MGSRQLGRFALIERVAEHGVDALWQARERVGGVERAVAVRTFPADEIIRLRLRRTVLLHHANVVEVKELGEADGRVFVARQWVAGCDWGRLLATPGRVPLRLHVLVALDVLRALEHAARLVDLGGRAAGVAHGRVSATNVLVSFEGEVKLTDFGLVDGRWADDAAAVATLLGRAPSQPQGLSAIVARAGQAGAYAEPSALRDDLEGWARREGLLLSPAELGQLARDVVSGASASKAARPVTVPPVAAAAAPASGAIRPFDQALGMGLAALWGQSDDADEPPPPATPQPIIAATPPSAKPDRRATRTVAAQPVLALAATQPSPTVAGAAPVKTAPTPLAPSPTATAPIARRPRQPLVLLGGGALALFIGVGWWAHHNHPPAPSLLALPPQAQAQAQIATRARPVAAPAAHPVPAPTVVTIAAPKPSRAPTVHAAKARPAHLSITADVPCDAMVDGRFVGQTPLANLELAPGHHVVRLESTMAGLRLIPREETVDLVAGESRPLKMVMQ